MGDRSPSATERRLRRLLFVEAPLSPTPDTRTTHRFVVTALLARRRPMRVSTFVAAVRDRVIPALLAHRNAWGIESLSLRGAAPLSRPVVFFMELTRTYPIARRLCALTENPLPPRYALGSSPLYDAIVECGFAAAPDDAAIAALRSALTGAAEGLVRDLVVLGSSRQVQVYDDHSPADMTRRVDICFLVNRPPSMSREACQDYWRHQHAQLALRNMKYLGLTRYLQVHTVPTPRAGLDDTYDGVVYAEKASLGRLWRDLMKVDTARFNNTVVVDESHFTHATPVMLMQRRGVW